MDLKTWIVWVRFLYTFCSFRLLLSVVLAVWLACGCLSLCGGSPGHARHVFVQAPCSVFSNLRYKERRLSPQKTIWIREFWSSCSKKTCEFTMFLNMMIRILMTWNCFWGLNIISSYGMLLDESGGRVVGCEWGVRVDLWACTLVADMAETRETKTKGVAPMLSYTTRNLRSRTIYTGRLKMHGFSKYGFWIYGLS